MGDFKLYLTPDDIRQSQKALRGPLDRNEANVMACAAAVLAAMEGSTLVFPLLRAASPSPSSEAEPPGTPPTE